ncbi:MAG TPA: EamA family transporter [Candidatus Acidoferrales bacterium]|nr:EamA family transporter [Candidatus Acidoferrales bacterium]
MGAAAIFARYALGGAAPLAVAAARLCIASAVLLAIAALHRGARVQTNAMQRGVLFGAGIALAVHFATWIASLEYTSVAVSTLLVATTPLWTTLYDGLVLRRRYPRAVPVAFIAGIAGLAMVTSANHNVPPVPGHALAGALLALTGSAAFAAYLLLVRGVRAQLTTRAIVTTTYTTAAIVLVAAAAFARESPPGVHAYAAWGGILAMALVSQLLGHTGMNAALRWFSPSAVSFSNLIEPVIAAALALLIFGERFSPLAAMGGCLVLGSIGIVLWLAPD